MPRCGTFLVRIHILIKDLWIVKLQTWVSGIAVIHPFRVYLRVYPYNTQNLVVLGVSYNTKSIQVHKILEGDLISVPQTRAIFVALADL